MKTIPLTRGYAAVVDDEDFAQLCGSTWSAHVKRWSSGTKVYARDSRTGELMHRRILGCSARIDHVDGDGLNNRRANLRHATHRQNMRNKRKLRKAASAFKGVTWSRRWRARIVTDAGRQHLGYFATEQAAACAYDRAARAHFGEFALTNFPEEVAPP